MIGRMLLYVDRTPGMTRTTDWALELARRLSSRVFAVSVLDPSAARHSPRNQAAAAEEQAWELLYEIEDDAFGRDVRISLLLEQGDPLHRVLSLETNYDIELIVASGDCRLPVTELVKQSTRPVVFVR